MSKRFSAWLRMLTKHLFGKKLFWLLLCCIIIMSTASGISNSSRHVIDIALYCETPDELTSSALKTLTETSDGLYKFYNAPSASALTEDVLSRKAECGYIFPADLTVSLQNGSKNIIEVVASSSTTLTPMVDEAVYDAVFHEYAQIMLADYIAANDIVPLKYDELLSLVKERYAVTEEGSSVFHVVYDQVPDDFYDNSAAFKIPLRGLMALLVLLAALAGIAQFRHDRQKGCFLLRFSGEKFFVPAIYALLPALFTAFSGFLGLVLSGSIRLQAGSLAAEAFLILAYAVICCIPGLIFNLIIRSNLLFDALIPVCLIFCMLYSPVFMDLSSFLPLGHIIKLLAPSSWYLLPAGML